MKMTHLIGLQLEVSVKKECKSSLLPVWKILDKPGRNRIWLGHEVVNWKGDRFGIRFSVDAEHWEAIRKELDFIKKFYPEAEVKLEVSSF